MVQLAGVVKAALVSLWLYLQGIQFVKTKELTQEVKNYESSNKLKDKVSKLSESELDNNL